MTSDEIKCRIAAEELREFWPEWKIVRVLGTGSFGDVFQICRESFGVRVDSALKIIRVSSRQLLQYAPQDGVISGHDPWNPNHPHHQNGQREIPEQLLNEIRIMEALKGAPNIVAVEDFHIKREGNSDSLFVRMELLTSFQKQMERKKQYSVQEAVKLGTDICTALMYCEKKQILHRDIKPANLFADSFGNYKVGDFGASRHMETMHPAYAMTSIGTISYMAPEVFAGKNYDHTVDLYSLGLVLYQLLNNERVPFLPSAPAAYTVSDIERANYRRLHGAEIPSIAGVRRKDGSIISPELDFLIRKACRVDPAERYRTAEEFREALRKYSESRKQGAALRHSVPLRQNAPGQQVSLLQQSDPAQRQQGDPVRQSNPAQRQQGDSSRQRDPAQRQQRDSARQSDPAQRQQGDSARQAGVPEFVDSRREEVKKAEAEPAGVPYFFILVKKTGRHTFSIDGTLERDRTYSLNGFEFRVLSMNGEFVQLNIYAYRDTVGKNRGSLETGGQRIGLKTGIPVLFETEKDSAGLQCVYYFVITRQFQAERGRFSSFVQSESRNTLLRTSRINCFQEMMNYADRDPAVRRAVQKMVEGASVYGKDFYSFLYKRRAGTVRIREGLSLEIAKQYVERGMKTAVLSFSNPVEPGGGILRGAQGQEQHLCRMSALYKSLISTKGSIYYSMNQSMLQGKYPGNRFIGGDVLLYSPNVPVLKENSRPSPVVARNADGEEYLEEPYFVDIITCAAPFFASQKYVLPDKMLLHILERRIRMILESAIEHQAEAVILGAYGCGAFHNPPRIVAEAFRNVLAEDRYKTAFDRIVFALGDRKTSMNSMVYKYFSQVFSQFFSSEFKQS